MPSKKKVKKKKKVQCELKINKPKQNKLNHLKPKKVNITKARTEI